MEETDAEIAKAGLAGQAWRLLIVLVVLAVAVVLAGLAALLVADTGSGRDFLVRQFARIQPDNGLTVRVGRIDGSLFDTLRLHDLRFGDPKGDFLIVPVADLDWAPSRLLVGHVSIRDISAPEARWLRLPALRPTERTGPILPDIDIDIGRLTVGRIDIDKRISGTAQVARLDGIVHIRNGRARIDATASTATGSDRIALKLDAEPDRDRFDAGLDLSAPVPGVLASLAGLKRPVMAKVSGKGRWSDWRGTAVATVGNARLADLAIRGTRGQFSIGGRLVPGVLTGGWIARLGAPSIRVDATALALDRKVEATLRLGSPALRLGAQGTLDFAAGRFDGVQMNARLLRPGDLIRTLSGRALDLALNADGPFARPRINYVFTAPQLALGTTRLDDVRLSGSLVAGDDRTDTPTNASVGRITGTTPLLEDLLRDIRITGPLRLKGLVLSSPGLGVRTARITGKVDGEINLATGIYDARIAGNAPGYPVPGLGLVDITSTGLRIQPAPDSGKPQIAGPASARVTRLDNSFFRTVLEGLPVVTGTIALVPGKDIQFGSLLLVSPGVRLEGDASRAPDGNVRINASGNAQLYGPVSLTATGRINRPTVDLRFPRPGFGVGLASVSVHLVPNADGFGFSATGRSTGGPVSTSGRLILREQQPLVVDVQSLNTLGFTARGTLRQSGSTLAGTLPLKGQGLTGTLLLGEQDRQQRITVTLEASNAAATPDRPYSIARGTMSASVLLDRKTPSVTAEAALKGVGNAGIQFGSLDLKLAYRGGHGSAEFRAAGRSGLPFSGQASATFTPDSLNLTGGGMVRGQTVKLVSPAVMTRDGTDWELAPVTLELTGGSARISGRFGSAMALDARLDRVSLSLLDLYNPDIELDGRVSGNINLRVPAGGGLPQGSANLRISGFERAGVATGTAAVDLALTAAIRTNAAAARMVIQQGGKIVGRAQAQLFPVPGSNADPLVQRLLATPLKAQLRLNGPAESIWPLFGIDSFDVRGPVTVSADMAGKLGEPTISGRVRSTGGRIESTVLGTIVDGIAFDSRFDGSRLVIASVSGNAGKGGRITGSGSIDLSANRNFPISMDIAADNAVILRRDDLQATASGPIRIRSDAQGGVVSGDLRISAARFRFGTTTAEAVPELAYREVGVRPAGAMVVRRLAPTRWRLDVKTSAARDIRVEGLGLQSEWSADLAISGPTDTPRLTGTADLLRGTYEFAGKRFELTRGRLRFGGGYPPDPLVDIAAESRVDGLTATLRISGTALKPQITFSSIPALPEDELLSRILFGTSITALSAPEALQLAGAVAALREGNARNFDIFGVIRRGLGVDRLRILPGDTTRNRGASVAVGEYFGDRVYVEVASDAQGYTATQIEVALTRSLSILSQVATFGGTSVNLKWSKDY